MVKQILNTKHLIKLFEIFEIGKLAVINLVERLQIINYDVLEAFWFTVSRRVRWIRRNPQ